MEATNDRVGGRQDRKNGLPCTACGESTGVFDSRRIDGRIRRRRQCIVCGHRFTTLEIVVPDGIGSDAQHALIAKLASEAAAITLRIEWSSRGLPIARVVEDDRLA